MRRTVLLLLGLVLTGCAVSSPPKSANPDRFLTLTPASLGRNLALSQLVTGTHGGDTYRARYEVEVVGDRLAIVGLSPIGLTLFTLVQRGEEVSVDSRLAEVQRFDPRYTLFDLYLTYWPESTLKPALEMIGMTLETADGSRERTVRDDQGRRVATVVYPEGGSPAGAIVIEHFDRPYRLEIRPIRTPGGG